LKLIILDVNPVPDEFPVENEMLFKPIGLMMIEPDLALQSMSVVMKM
jgi:hypothetical protein